MKRLKNKIGTFFRGGESFHIKELLRGSFASVVFQIIGKVAGFIFAWLVVQWYGNNIWGQLAFSISVITIVKNTSQFGFHSALVKIVAESNKTNNRKAVLYYYSRSMLFVVTLSILLCLAVFYASDFISNIFLSSSEGFGSFLRQIIFSVVPMVITVVNGNTLRGLKKIWLFSLFVNCLMYLSIIAFIVVIFYGEMSGYSLPELYFMGATIAALVSTIATYRAVSYTHLTLPTTPYV